MRISRELIAVVTFFVLAGAAAAGPLEDANVAFRQQDYATALRILGPLADGGSRIAQYDLGVLYQNGQGVDADQSVSLHWFLRSAGEH